MKAVFPRAAVMQPATPLRPVAFPEQHRAEFWPRPAALERRGLPPRYLSAFPKAPVKRAVPHLRLVLQPHWR
jgi:hypothetical protein